ncbi:hypothetical protein [Mesoflavibacter zeaxanthinifaciens]|uniref:hypothetical protein n=1 Tax=Mesoflavibacter zeaxanthinifaciens TaxID=393060 RepID=UPI0026F16B5C|nr:hypothetical protein [Mesoflavibacter zeaxanthinifaciens]
MRKAIFIIFLICISCNSNLKYLNQFDGFNGKPKKIESTTYKIEYKDSVATEKMAYKNIEFYDSKGRKIKTLMYKSDGSPSTGGIYYSYDKFGNEIKSIMYKRDSTINSENLSKYDKYGNKIEGIYISGNRKSSTKRIYDRKNKTVKIIGKKGDGSFKENAIQKYDDKWNKIELISYDSIGNQKTRIEFGYDKNYNLNSYKWYNSKNELYNFSKTTFNENNDPIIALGYRVKNKDTILNKTTKFEYKYDEKKNVIEQKLFSNDKLVWTTKYNYEY